MSLSDGERRYGNTLFEMCAEVLRTGLRGRPPLPPDVKVRLKNKGSQNSKPGRKRLKYQAQNAALRRKYLSTTN